jgi:hypothetical protein
MFMTSGLPGQENERLVAHSHILSRGSSLLGLGPKPDFAGDDPRTQFPFGAVVLAVKAV